MKKEVDIKLSEPEALVLLEFLLRSDGESGLPVEHEAETQVLWKLEGILEKTLTAVLDEGYRERVAEARRLVASDGGAAKRGTPGGDS